MQLSIGEKIALLRKRKDVTQTQLAEYLFLAPQTVSRWESGGGTPDIAMLPKIAAFFGVSIDELFGVTSLRRTEDLVSKYSVLRDDRSFREAMDCIDSQLQTVDAALNSGGGSDELEKEQDQLNAEKVHMWIQLGRESFGRALAIAEDFIEKTHGDPGHQWYLPMRLQRDQLCDNLGRGRETLSERENAFTERPDHITLLRYLSMLDQRQEFEKMLSLFETDGPAREIILPASEENLSLWYGLVHAAAETGDTGFIEQYLPPVLEVCGPAGELDLLMCLLKVYDGERLAAIKRRVLSILPEAGLNPYFEEKAREKINLA